MFLKTPILCFICCNLANTYNTTLLVAGGQCGGFSLRFQEMWVSCSVVQMRQLIICVSTYCTFRLATTSASLRPVTKRSDLSHAFKWLDNVLDLLLRMHSRLPVLIYRTNLVSYMFKFCKRCEFNSEYSTRKAAVQCTRLTRDAAIYLVH